ncbi:MFS transporter [Lichenicoccus sp.]|uniref:MFS transporter n=1 Tax=Lichenicoccus sp. TaxID=2781899 RepID=UPI003D0CBD8B
MALGGIIVAALSTELNQSLSSILLGDIGGGLGMSHDSGTWFDSLYLSAEVFGMAVSPWFAVTLSLRRWSLFVIALTCVSTVFIPLTSNLTLLYGLRTVQGLCGGLTIPLLMTTALRALGPQIRLFGLAAYALTVTFFPNLSAAIAAFWVQNGAGPGWPFAFYEAVPLAAIAAVLVWHGMPQDPRHYERFAKFDWRGAALVLVGLGSLSTMLQQGNRLDWFNSRMICVLGLVGLISVPLLILNEWFHELPLLKFQMLGRRNLAYGLIALILFVIIAESASTIPNDYLAQVAGIRPEQSYPVTALIAAAQLLLLPAMALLLNYRWADARVFSFAGLACMLTACIGDSFLTSVWQPGQFFLWQLFAAFGEAMVVMPLLMMATNSVTPDEGPYASSLVNTPRAIGQAVGVWLLQLVQHWRGALHTERLASQLGLDRFRLRLGTNLGGMTRTIEQQAAVLTLSDAFLVMAALIVALMLVLLVLPVRTYPPRIVFADK